MFNAEEYFIGYLDKVQDALRTWDMRMMERILVHIIYTIDHDNTIYLIGNGGSMATASHLACDLNYVLGRELGKRVKVVALDSLPTIMAIGNDDGFPYVFEKQLQSLLRSGDLVIAFSGSGNSYNILRAVLYANEQGAFTIGVTGFDGGHLKNNSKLCFHIPVFDMQITEDCHMIFGHLLMRSLLEYYRQPHLEEEEPE